MSAAFSISAWRAWAPGLDSHSNWLRWRRGEIQATGEIVADVSFLPAMQRRRLSPLAKAAFATAYPLLGQRDLPLLCCSVHGEVLRTYSLLKDVVAADDLSPTAFGLSVHNAIAGQLSILGGIQAPTLALAGGNLPLQAGFLEAVGMLADGVSELVLVFCDEPLPDLYRLTARSASHICATAIALRTEGAQGDMRCSLTKTIADPAVGPASAFDDADYQLPLIAALVDRCGSVALGEGWEVQIHG